MAEEEKERSDREAEKLAREAEENWKKEKSVMPPPIMKRLTGEYFVIIKCCVIKR